MHSRVIPSARARHYEKGKERVGSNKMHGTILGEKKTTKVLKGGQWKASIGRAQTWRLGHWWPRQEKNIMLLIR